MSREQKIYFVRLFLLLGTGFSIIVHYLLGLLLHMGYPYNTFLFRSEDRFMDFVWPYRISSNPYAVARPDFQNFPVLYRIASLFTWVNVNTALIIFLSLYVTSFLFMNWKQLKTNKHGLSTFSNILIFSILTYPFLFSFDRANFEVTAFFCLYYLFF